MMGGQCTCCGAWMLQPSEVETLDFVKSYAPYGVPSAALAERLGITLPNANNRLRGLEAKGILVRIGENVEGGGRRFMYWAT